MFAVLLLSDFRLQAVLRLRPELRAEPVAVVDDRATRGIVLELNHIAEAQGVRVGLPSVQALARCPALVLQPRVLGEEHVVQSILLEVAGSLSPEVEATSEGCCTVDLRTARIADWNAWSAMAARRLSALGVDGRVGVAPNPDLAFLAARRAEPALVVQSPTAFLSQLALAEIEPPPHLLALLQDWGIHTLGQLTSLPRGDFADRLGPDAERLWQRASGETTRLLRLVRPVEEFVEAFEFEHEIETIEPLLFILRRFLDQLALRLTDAHRVAAKLVLTLPLEDGQVYERDFTIPSPTADPEMLFRILHTHLETLQLEKRPVSIRLLVAPVRPDHQQLRLFESPLRDPNRFGETLARLNALVGSQNVGVAEIADTHRPDAFALVEPRFHELCETTGEPAPYLATGLPLRRYRPPVPAEVRVVRHRPVQVESALARGYVTEVLGPYRASGDWWEREQWSVEEWDIEIAEQGLYRLCRQPGGWVIQGCYDAELH